MQPTENKWIEIISVRLFSLENRDRVREIIDHVGSGRCPVTGTAILAELYVNQTLEMDWSIHLIRSGIDAPPDKTSLGSNIAQLFATLGIINHSVWERDLNQGDAEHGKNEWMKRGMKD